MVALLLATCLAPVATVRPLTPADVVPGRWAEGRPGDWLLSNDVASFVVAGDRRPSGYGMQGGRLLDAWLRGERPGRDAVGEWILGVAGSQGILGMRTLQPLGFKAQSEDGVATLVVRVRDARLPIWDQTTGIKTRELEAEGTLEYRLAAGRATLEVTLRLPDAVRQAVLVATLDDDQHPFADGAGSIPHALRSRGKGAFMGAARELDGPFAWVGGLGNDHGVAYVPLGGFASLLVADTLYALPLRREDGAMRFSVVLSRGGSEAAEGEARRLAGVREPGRRFTGTVRGPDGRGRAGARVVFTDPESGRFLGRAVTNREGRFDAPAPIDAVRAVVYTDWAAPTAAGIRAGSPAVLQASGPGRLRLAVSSAGEPVPFALLLERLDPPPMTAERDAHGEARDFGRFTRVHFGGLGRRETIAVEPGRYRATVTRGFEYEVHERELEVVSASETALEATLARTAPMPGYLSSDFHTHTLLSPDSSVSFEDFLRAQMGMGVAVVAVTDHDRVTDLQPTVERAGWQGRIFTVPGVEVSPTNGVGHYQAFPVKARPEEPNHGAPDWYDLTAAEVLRAARGHGEARTVVMVNHPRSRDGFFTHVDWNPDAGAARKPERWSPDFDAVEVLNGTDWAAAEAVYRDWVSLLDMGLRPTPIGNTDSHRPFRVEAGFPRTYLRYRTNDTARLRPDDVFEAVTRGDSVVSAGHALLVTAAGSDGRPVRPGGVVTAPGPVRVHIEARAASWVGLDRVWIVGPGGRVLREWTVARRGEGPTEFRAEHAFADQAPAWFAVRSSGPGFRAVYPAGLQPGAFTNAIRIGAEK